MRAGWTTTGAVFLTALPGLVSGCSPNPSETAADNAATNSTLLIEPNLAVGQVHAGMTMAQVVAALGEPQRRTSNSLEYSTLGLAVMPDADGKVQVVMCGDVTGINGPFAKAFTGRTKEGIGMFSTREDVLNTYGQPSAEEKMRGGLESLQYEALGMTFTLEAGKVHHVIVRLRGSPPTDRSVTLVPAPENSAK